MNAPITDARVEPGDVEYVDETWRLKERIRAVDGVLEQGERFFRFQYQRCTVYLCVRDDVPVSFAVVRADGYLSLLGVDPDHRRRGLGRRLIQRAARSHDRISCHTRVDNEGAVAFYTALGFDVSDRVPGYYRDGGDAYELELRGQPAELDRILEVLDR